MNLKRLMIAGLIILTVAVAAFQVERAQASVLKSAVSAPQKIEARGGGEQHGAGVRNGGGDEGRGKGNNDERGNGKSNNAPRLSDNGRHGDDDGNKYGRSGDFKMNDNGNRKTVQLRGTITSLTGGSFVIGNQTIVTNNATRIEGTLALGARVGVQAARQGNGSVLALKIEVKGRHVENEGEDENEDENDDENEGDEDSGNVTPVLQSPTGLVAVLSGSQVNLTWSDNSNNETGFRVERATDSAFAVNFTAVTLSANATSLGDTTVVAGNSYYYRVFTYNAGGDSAPSNLVLVAVPSTIDAVALYSANCASCHGANRQGGGGKPEVTSAALSARTVGWVTTTIGSHASNSSHLTSAEIAALAQWLKSTP